MVPQEICLIVSSDPDNGAVNRSQDGSYFEIQLQDGLSLPAEALNPTLCVEEATVWWTVPNIITGINDKMYITGPAAEPEITNRTVLGFPPASTYAMTVLSPEASNLELRNIAGGMPIGVFVVGDVFRPDSGVSNGFLYEIIGIVEDTANSKTYNVSGLLEGNIAPNTGEFSRVRGGGTNNYDITIPQGLYDLNGINQAILRELENAGAKIDPNPLFSLSPDEPTSKVEIRINYSDVSINFAASNTPRIILGFDSAVYGPYPTAPISILAPNVAAFNQVNYFLIHSDLTNKGIRFNNNYNQTVAQVLIDVAPGSQIVSRPFNPARIAVPELVNAKRNNIRMWLTDDKDNRIYTNNEYWTARIVIRYLKPYMIGSEAIRK